jgi:hypothetical protein
MPLYRTEFEIEASDKQVGAVLTDFESYPDWNPSLPAISGELSEGSTVSLTLGMPGRPDLKVKATLQDVTPNRRITWHGNVGGNWLFAGDPSSPFSRSPRRKVWFTHVEDISGSFAPVFEVLMAGAQQRSHDDESLRNRAEHIAAKAARA